MEITLNIKDKEKKFKSKEITFRAFLKGTDLMRKMNSGEFLGDNYDLNEMNEAVELIINYFGNQFTQDDFYDGFKLEDSLDFFALFNEVLINIQMNDGKRSILEGAEGKSQVLKQG